MTSASLFANGALLGPDGELFAISQATWPVVDRSVQLGEARWRLASKLL